MAKGIMDVCPDCCSYTTLANFGRVVVGLPEQQKVGEVASASQKVIHIKDERF